ncbi:hypothetical protein BC938DRAFT_479259 [Jimgerdemannia flammicorona]|uniref:Uncharacterized protein n=1 Tax=Jimgerdemannia flammicorona TaxID=994334 RepID=A0A433QLB1_9FUNG|nr:hypothetical protein BC938DRAFT_479259 [Jimgerdemannia flammicorona]
MPPRAVPEEILSKLCYPEYWERPISKWGNVNRWDQFFTEKNPNATKHISRSSFGVELQTLVRNLEPGTRAIEKAISMQHGLKKAGHTVAQLSSDDPPPYNGPSRKRSRDDEDEERGEPEMHTPLAPGNFEELTFDPRVGQMLLPYRRILEEMRRHQTEETSKRARHLSVMLMWSVVDQSLFFKGSEPVASVALPRPAVNISLLESVLMENQSERIQHAVMIMRNLRANGVMDDASSGLRRWLARLRGICYIIDVATVLSAITSVLVCSLTPCRGPGSKPSENNIKAQLWTKIFQDVFLLGQDNIDVNWEYHHQIPGNGGTGSARSDFAAVILNEADQQFPFFIVEFEANGLSVHKDAMVAIAETAFEYNRILAAAPYLSEDEVNATCLHIGLVNGTSIRMGSMKAVYNETKESLIYVYDADKAIFKLRTGNQEADIASALVLMAYLRRNVCKDGMVLKMLLKRKPKVHHGALLAALPRLPKQAVKSRPHETEFTPKAKRVRFIDNLLNY